MKPIQMVDLRSQYDRLKNKIDQSIENVILSTSFINGKEVHDFADNFAKYNECRYVIPCANGTDALQIAMMALNFKAGDEVIAPAFTYIATVEVIALLGLKPIFVDVREDTFNIDLEKLEAGISDRTVGIVPVHLFGQCAEMKPLLDIAKKYNLKVIEDTAQAVGADYFFSDGTTAKAGTIGDIGCTSFFPSKNLGCYGDGGALMTNDSQIAERLSMIANHGQSKKYIHDSIGVNSRLDTIQAAILNVKLKELDDFKRRRIIVADNYDLAFKGISEIEIPYRSEFSSHVFHQYTLKLNRIDREDFKAFLASKEIPSMIYYPIPVHLQKAYSEFGYKQGDFPVTEDLCSKVISLPIHTEMQQEEQAYIIEVVNKYFK